MAEERSKEVLSLLSTFSPATLLDELDEKVLLADRDGNIVFANEAFARWLGRPSEALVALPLYKLFSEVPGIADLFEEKGTVLTIQQHERQTAFSVKAISPELVLVNEHKKNAVSQDSATQTAIEEAEWTLDPLYVNLAARSLIWEYDLEQDRVICNKVISTVYGYEWRTEGYGRDWWRSKIHPDDLPEFRDKFNTMLQKKIRFWSLVYRFKKSDGTFSVVLNRLYVIYNEGDKAQRVIGDMIDITEEKQVEEELKMMNYALGKHAVELARSNEELEQFAYVASHDLQEPLRTITGFANLLSERNPEHLDAKSREYLGFIVDGAKRMQLLIRNLLEYSRVTTREQELKKVNLGEIVDYVRSSMSMVLAETKGKIVAQDLPNIVADESQLQQLFLNLAGNAIKFGKPGIAPIITISAEEEENYWKITMADNGIGIDPENAHRIFQVFQRLHTREEYPGTGIGLAISKKIVEKHRGEIWLESKPTEGSKFHFRLPKKL